MNCVMVCEKLSDGRFSHKCQNCGIVRISSREQYIRHCFGRTTDVHQSVPAIMVMSTDEIDRRKAICADCSEKRADDELWWCNLLDDNHSDRWNCTKSKHGRYIARLARMHNLCGRWYKLASLRIGDDCCYLCGLQDPITEPAPNPVPKHWFKRTEVKTRYIDAMRDLLTCFFIPPPSLSGQGVLYVCTTEFWPMTVVAIKMLRTTGCKLPVQIWHEGPIGKELDGYKNVQFIDIDEFRKQHPAKGRHPWALKLYAVAHCGWEKVIFIDADAYAVNDVSPLFETVNDRVGLAFWQDLPSQAVNWTLLGFNGSQLPPIQGGHLIIDVKTFWRTLVLSNWANQNDSFWYSVGYGDQDAMRIMLAATGDSYTCLGKAEWDKIAFVCKYKEQSMIVHRCQAKMLKNKPVRTWKQLPMESEMASLWNDVRKGYKNG